MHSTTSPQQMRFSLGTYVRTRTARMTLVGTTQDNITRQKDGGKGKGPDLLRVPATAAATAATGTAALLLFECVRS